MRCESKRLWEEKLPSSDEINWVDEIPATTSVPLQSASNKTDHFALLLRTQLRNGLPKLHSIVIQSPLLKVALKDILQDYPGISLYEDPMVFESPFKPFVHRWEELKAACEQTRDTEAGRHLKLLESILEPELQGVFSIINNFATHGTIEFDHLWTIFVPGTLVVSTRSGRVRGFNLKDTELRKPPWEDKGYFILQCYYIDWDGTRFGTARADLVIREFKGSSSLSDLTEYPLAYHPQKDLLIAELRERGKKFQEYADMLIKTYDGVALDSYERKYQVSATKKVFYNVYDFMLG
jgi:hypothetical protein